MQTKENLRAGSLTNIRNGATFSASDSWPQSSSSKSSTLAFVCETSLAQRVARETARHFPETRLNDMRIGFTIQDCAHGEQGYTGELGHKKPSLFKHRETTFWWNDKAFMVPQICLFDFPVTINYEAKSCARERKSCIYCRQRRDSSLAIEEVRGDNPTKIVAVRIPWQRQPLALQQNSKSTDLASRARHSAKVFSLCPDSFGKLTHFCSSCQSRLSFPTETDSFTVLCIKLPLLFTKVWGWMNHILYWLRGLFH